jgi:hypothetical protein
MCRSWLKAPRRPLAHCIWPRRTCSSSAPPSTWSSRSKRRVSDPSARSDHQGRCAGGHGGLPLAFFGLTFALSWSLWGLQSLLADADPISARWLGIVAAYGPTLAAITLLPAFVVWNVFSRRHGVRELLQTLAS